MPNQIGFLASTIIMGIRCLYAQDIQKYNQDHLLFHLPQALEVLEAEAEAEAEAEVVVPTQEVGVVGEVGEVAVVVYHRV
jgi:hypothetical protein